MIKQNKIKPSYITKAQADMQYMMLASPFLLCDKCKTRLGLMRCIRYALFKKKGSEYLILCPICGNLNKRIKGGLNTELENRWTD